MLGVDGVCAQVRFVRWVVASAIVVWLGFAGVGLSAELPARNVALFSTGGDKPVELPAVFDGRVLLQVEVNAKQLWFHLDTGTGGLVIAAKDAADAGLVFDPAVLRTQPVDVRIGAVTARAWFSVLPSYGFEANGRRVSGLLGGPFFHANVVKIDYPHQHVVFYPPGTFTPPQGIASTPIEFVDNTPTVEVAFGAVRGRFLVDTGAGVTELTAAFAKRVSLGAYRGRIDLQGGGGPRHRTDFVYMAPDIIVGSVAVRGSMVAVGESGGGTADEGNDGILGRDILSRFAITFDYANSAAYFDTGR
jgi:hypothetical protein